MNTYDITGHKQTAQPSNSGTGERGQPTVTNEEDEEGGAGGAVGGRRSTSQSSDLPYLF